MTQVNEFIDFALLALYPETTGGVLLYACAIAIAIFGLFLKFGSHMRGRLVKGIITSVVLSLLYCLVLTVIVPCCQKFSNDTIGMLLPRFSGARLSEHFGQKHLNEVLEMELRNTLEKRHLDNLLSVRSTSWVVSSSAEADNTKRRYNAQIILWGQAVKLEQSASLSATLDSGEITFVAVMPDGNTEELPFHVVTTGQYQLRLFDSSYNIDRLVHNIINDCLLPVAARISTVDLEASERLIRKIPELDRRIQDLELEYVPFAIQQAAFAFYRSGDIRSAMGLYALSYSKFERLKQRIDDGSTSLRLPIEKVRRFAAVSKYQEGYHALSLSDTTRSLRCFELAAITDSAFTPYFVEWHHLLTGEEIDSIHVIKFDSPFVDPQQ